MKLNINDWFSIKKYSGTVRLKLFAEDIEYHFADEEVLQNLGLLEIESNIRVFRDAFVIPDFSKYYGSKITSVNDPFLEDLIKDILYLNPNPGKLGLKNITETIVHSFVACTSEPSMIKEGEEYYRPVLSFEDLIGVVTFASKQKDVLDYKPSRLEFILYSKDNDFNRHQKRAIKMQVHRERAMGYYGDAIHHTVEYLMVAQPLIKITYPRIKNTELVSNEVTGLPISVRLIRDYITENTKDTVGRHNEKAPFKSVGTAEKYDQYLTLPKDSSISDTATELNVSKSTVLEFRKLAEK